MILGLAGLAALGFPKVWKSGPRPHIWLVAGLVGLLASFYLQARSPHPAAHDISASIPTSEVAAQEQVVNVQGLVDSVPHITRSQKAQFWLAVTQLNGVTQANLASDQGKPVTGKLYVTVPLLQATGLYPGQAIAITGNLYKPKPAENPGAFDFQAYLAREGCFAALRGKQVEPLDRDQQPGWGWWQVRQRIVQAQIRWLGSPAGQLLSSMVIGSRAVDLPADVKDQFRKVGLAHALAASGFQTSLILAVVLGRTRRLPARAQFAIGITALTVFVGLTGIEPSVLRAAVMGAGAMLALVMKRKVKPLGSLLLTAVILLVINPLWIWNLGFQLSFLATMGLLVTVPPLTKRLDWLPSALSPLIAVPISAYLWTLPLQLYTFGVVSPYSIPVNIITTPLISILSLGGIVSALAAIVWMPAGSALAWLLDYPTRALLAVVDFASHLTGSEYATGTLPLVLVLLLYGLIGLVWLNPWWRSRWWIALFLGAVLAIVPTWQARATLFRVTVLATPSDPVMVVQAAGKTGLINSGDEATAHFTVLPFLQKEGINHLDWAIATNTQSSIGNGWTSLLARLPIQQFYDTGLTKETPLAGQTIQSIQSKQGTYQTLPINQPTPLGSLTLQLISTEPLALQLQVQNQRWLLLDDLQPGQQKELVKANRLPNVQVLWWTGKPLDPGLLAILQPKVAIASASAIDANTETQFHRDQTQLYWTGRDGALQWTADEGFKTTLTANDNEAPAL
ncbi:MAG: ComEC/Rec2 family competence protein [Scytolyngbya sp. HA4215-MV1]|nr:ComEC/Rec2 family competence protein [Scytolyngbya sp. HA4215-MV1]